MIVLGACNANDSGAALIVDGRIVAAANEERFVRKKLVRGFPFQSIEWVLSQANLTILDVDYVGCGAWNGIDSETTLPVLVDDIFDQCSNDDGQAEARVKERLRSTLRSDSRSKQQFLDGVTELGLSHSQIVFCDHHRSHALTAFYCSPFEDSYVLCSDGRGDFQSTTLWYASRDHGVELIACASELASLGALYGYVTKYLGFIPDRHEGKVTGLAAHGKETEAYKLLRGTVFFDNESGRIRSRVGDYYSPFATSTLPKLAERLDCFSREDVSFAVQKVLEDVLYNFLHHHIGQLEGSSRNLCLAGGCMANVKLNAVLSKVPSVQNTYVFPAMGDGGNALGGAINAVLIKEKLHKPSHLETPYLGPCFDNNEIELVLKDSGMKYREVNREEKIAFAVETLSQGSVLGWFQGRMEYGPRALGGRSILVAASDPDVTSLLNERLDRSEFMPFAPVMTSDQADKCLLGWREDQIASEFMTICYEATSYLKQKCPGVVHVDGTVRPQVIFRNKNTLYFDVVHEYTARTGQPALINTSFNVHEEPIVNKPEEALSCLKRGSVDCIVVGDFIVEADV